MTALASEEHADAIAAFYREVWDPAATAESVVAATRQGAAQNVAAPGEPTPIALVFAGGRVVGYCGSIAQRLWDGVRERSAYWVKGLMVLPEYRNGPIGYLAVKELTRHLECATILTVAPAARRLFAALGYSDFGAVANWVRPLHPGVIIEQLDLDALGLEALPRWMRASVRVARRVGVARLTANAAGLIIHAATNVARLHTLRLETTLHGAAASAELDELWVDVRAGLMASPVRDGAYIRSRFGAAAEQGEQGNPYTLITTREQGRLLGIAAVRRPRTISDVRLGSIRVATVSELVFPMTRTDAGLATLGAIEHAARAARADAVTCMTSHSALATQLRRQGYLRVGGNVHFFLRDVTGTGQWPTDLASWWLGRGDGESDAVF